jgi:glutamine amidotransferase
VLAPGPRVFKFENMNPVKVAVIDYGAGNLLSVQRGLEHCGADVVLTVNPEKILGAERVVLPGVGAFGNAMQALGKLGLVSTIHELVRNRTPLLGICLGMQLLLEESEEFGITAGLGLIPGRVVPLPTSTVTGEPQKIPLIGWCDLQYSAGMDWSGTMLADSRPGEAVYCVHSFMAMPEQNEHRIADYVFGGHRVAAVIQRDRVTGCQFHPEKSGEVGLRILRKFISSIE